MHNNYLDYSFFYFLILKILLFGNFFMQFPYYLLIYFVKNT